MFDMRGWSVTEQRSQSQFLGLWTLTIFEDASKNVPDTAPYYITTILYVHAPLFKLQKKNLLLIILEVNRIIDQRLLILSIV